MRNPIRVKNLLAVVALSGLVFAGYQSFGPQGASAQSESNDGRLIAANDESSIHWHSSYDKTLKTAGQNRKWVFVDVYTDWCGWCKRLDKDVYENPTAIEFINKSFVAMKANAERGDGEMVAKKYGVSGFPCTLVLDPKGKEKGRISGYLDSNSFTRKLSQIVKR